MLPLSAHLRTAPRRRWAYLATALLLLTALLLADRRGWFSAAAGDYARYHHARLPVAQVLTADTLELTAPGSASPTLRVRLCGLTAPDPALPSAPAALALTRRLCEGASVRLSLDPTALRAPEGDLLAYVELPDGASLNEQLLSAGLAHADPRLPHRHLQRYQLLEAQARHDRLGLWRR